MAGIGLTSGAGMGSSSSSGKGVVSNGIGPSSGMISTPQTTGASIASLLGGKAPQQAINPANLPGGANYIQWQKDAAKGNTAAQGMLAGTMPLANTVGPAQYLGGSSVASPGAVQGLPSWGTPTASQPSATPAATPTVNTAEANPDSKAIIEQLRSRAAGDMGLPGELDAATREIRDRASAGIEGDTIAQIRSGRLGDSSGQRDADARGDLQREQINKITTDLTLGRERDRDALNLSTANLALGQSGQQLSATGQAQQAQLSQQAEARAQASDNWQRQAAADAAVRDAQQTSWNTLLNLLS